MIKGSIHNVIAMPLHYRNSPIRYCPPLTLLKKIRLEENTV